MWWQEAVSEHKVFVISGRYVSFSICIYCVCPYISGWAGHAVGPEWRQAPLHPGWWGHHQRPLLQPQPLLAVCCHWTQHQDLGEFMWIHTSHSYYIMDCIQGFIFNIFWSRHEIKFAIVYLSDSHNRQCCNRLKLEIASHLQVKQTKWYQFWFHANFKRLWGQMHF